MNQDLLQAKLLELRELVEEQQIIQNWPNSPSSELIPYTDYRIYETRTHYIVNQWIWLVHRDFEFYRPSDLAEWPEITHLSIYVQKP